MVEKDKPEFPITHNLEVPTLEDHPLKHLSISKYSYFNVIAPISYD